MEQKKAKVVSIQQNTRQFNGKQGVNYVHIISFENGDTGEYNALTQTCTKFQVGQEAEYTKEVKQNGQYTNTLIKPIYNPAANNPAGFTAKKPFGSSGSSESFALSYAKDIAVALIEKGKDMSAEKTLEVADKFYNWLQSKRTAAPAQQQNTNGQAAAPASTPQQTPPVDF